MKSRRHMMIAVALLAGLAGAAGAVDVKRGIDAWEAGNYAAAIREWRPLAEKGDPDAQFNMGQAYKLGRGVPADMKLAQSWYEKAASQGHEKAGANLGLILFQNGNRPGAMPWIKKAADRGDPRAQYILGTALFNGDLLAKDWPRAYALMTRAAAQGLPQAATSLAELDKYIPLEQRQQGILLARRMEASTTMASASPPPIIGQSAPARPAPAPSRPRVAVAPTPIPAAKAPPPAAKPAPVATAAAAPAPGGRWRIQLGAFPSPQAARAEWPVLKGRIGALAAFEPSYEPFRQFTRLRVGPLANRAAAERLCAAAKSAGRDCFTVAP